MLNVNEKVISKLLKSGVIEKIKVSKIPERLKELNRLVKNFSEMLKMNINDYKSNNIDLTKLLFNANCRSWELNKLIHNLKNKKEC